MKMVEDVVVKSLRSLSHLLMSFLSKLFHYQISKEILYVAAKISVCPKMRSYTTL